MILLCNAINLEKGGAVQVALSFIQECRGIPGHHFHVFLSNAIKKQLDTSGFPSNFTFYTNPSPRNKFIRIFSNVRYLKHKIKIIQPDCVFTVFGPAYWKPPVPHLVGFAIPHYLYPDSPFFKTTDLRTRWTISMMKWLHWLLFKTNSRFLVTETEDVKKRLSRFIGRSESDIFTVSNTFHAIYNQVPAPSDILPPRIVGEFRLVTITASYPHKNLTIIRKVLPELQKRTSRPVRFFLTVAEREFQQHFSGLPEVINLGPIPVDKCPAVYTSCDALFLPTLLECFTASYPEAMKMNKPILTSDLSFARDICGDAALFFDPLDPADIAEKIVRLAEEPQLGSALIERGNQQLMKFETSGSRARKYLTICESIRKR